MRALTLSLGRALVLGMLALAPGCRCDRAPAGGVVLVHTGGTRRDNVRTLAIDETHVYFADGEHGSGFRLKRVPKAGGTIASLAEVKKAIEVLRLASDAVYFVINGVLFRVPKGGGPAQRLLEREDLCPGAAACGMALDESHVYATTTTGILRIPRQGGPPRELVGGFTDARDPPVTVTLDATHVYWAQSLKMGIFRVPKAGGAIETVTLEGFEEACRPTLAVAGGFVYYLVSQSLYRAPVAGGTATLITAAGIDASSHPGGFQVTGEVVYFARGAAAPGAEARRPAGPPRTGGAGQGGVMRVVASGGEPVWLTRGMDRVYAVDVDLESVYFAGDGGQVMKFPR